MNLFLQLNWRNLRQKCVSILSEVRTFALQPIAYSWKWAIIQGSAIVGAFYLLVFPQNPGIAIGVLGLVGIIMAVRVEEKWGRTERIMWVIFGVLLMGAEVRAIDIQANVHNQEQAAMLEGQLEDLRAVKKNIDVSTETMGKTQGILKETQRVAELAQQAAENSTGGSSFVYLEFNPLVQMVTLFKSGNAPIYGLNMVISSGKPILPGYDPTEMRNWEARRFGRGDIPEGEGLVMDRGVFEIHALPPYTDFHLDSNRAYISIDFSARNGFWKEIEWLRNDGKGNELNDWLSAIRVYKTDDLRNSRKLIYEHIDPGFPREALKEH